MARSAAKSIALLAAAAWLWTGAAAEVAAQAVPATPVKVDAVRLEPLTQTVPVIGRLVARRAGELAARIAGPVREVRVHVGDRVEAGQVVAVLVDDSLRATYELRRAEVTETEAVLKTATAELALRSQEMKRLQDLEKSAAFSKARLDDVKQERAMAAGVLAEAQAQLGSAKASLELAMIDLAYAEVRASFPGVVSQRYAQPGAYLEVGDPVVRIIDDLDLEIEADVPTERVTGLTPGVRVHFELNDGSRHDATVRAVVPDENPLTRTRLVRFTPRFNGTSVPFAVNQSLTVEIPIGERRDVISVHKDAIINRGGALHVYLVRDGMAELRKVRIGESVDGRFEVLDGLQPGDSVVVRGNERLHPGQKLQPEEIS